jgi:hypothetical protein
MEWDCRFQVRISRRTEDILVHLQHEICRIGLIVSIVGGMFRVQRGCL